MFAALFLRFAAFSLVLPLPCALARFHENGGMLVMGFVFAGFFGMIALLLSGCGRYARLEHGGGPVVRRSVWSFLWCLVLLGGLVASVFLALILRVTISTTWR
jgi:hypothetical protein